MLLDPNEILPLPDSDAPGESTRPLGYCELDDLSVLRISGLDAPAFLQGQTTCDVNGVAVGQSRLGAFCNPKGRVVAQFRLMRGTGRFYLILPQELADTVRKRLQMYVLRSRVLIEDFSNRWKVLGLFGDGVPHCEAQDAEDPDRLCVALEDGTGRSLVLATVAAAESIAQDLRDSGEYALKDARDWRFADIGAGIPQVFAATSEAFLPQMLNLDLLGGIGFKKGCYTGQEIVTRTQFLGHLKRRMFRFRCAGEDGPVPGANLYSQGPNGPQVIGQVVAAGREAEGLHQFLAVVALDQVDCRQINVAMPEGPTASRLPLPYTFPENPIPDT